MVAVIAALGYGFGYSLAKRCGWPEAVCVAACLALGIVDGLIAQKPQVLDACDEILRSLLDTSALDDKRKRAEHERDTITGQIQALVERQAKETVEAFAEKYQELEKKYRRAEERLKAVDAERRDREYRLKQAELFMATLKKMPEGEQIESNELFMALVDKVIVGEGLTFVLRDGSTRGVRF